MWRPAAKSKPGLGLGHGASFALGAALMYGLDPGYGRRRRALARDRADHLVHSGVRGVQKGLEDAGNRLHGLQARFARPVREHVDDVVLAERVRTRLGHACSYPHAVRAIASDGTIELKGPILKDEAQHVLASVSRVPGVKHIVDALVRHESGEGVAGLQGRAARRPRRAEWSPGMRCGVGAAGVVLAAAGSRRAWPAGALASLLGGALVVRAATNRAFASLVGARPGACAIDVTKVITVRAPIAEVFDFFARFENFSKFMRHVREVKHLGGARWRWSVEGPLGTSFEWDAIVTQLAADRAVAWTSTHGALVPNRGEARFESLDGGSTTRMTIHLQYEPPLGELGHAIAKVFGADPKHELDDDLNRFKSLLERGKATGRGGVVTRAELGGGR